MGEIRIVGSGKTCGYPYPVCKKNFSNSQAKSLVWEYCVPACRGLFMNRSLQTKLFLKK